MRKTYYRMRKTYYRMNNVGKAKYTISYHDGISTHKDGSAFFAIRIFCNKKRMLEFISSLTEQGYIEC